VAFGFDDVALEIVHEITHNPGFEDGDSNLDGIPDYWLGYPQADTYLETVNDETAHTGNYWAKLGVDDADGWVILYWPVLPAQPGETWSIRSFIKDVSDDTTTGDFAFLKIAVKDANQTTFTFVESYQPATTEWKDFSYEQVMPLNTSYMQISLGVKKHIKDNIPVAYGFDDVRLVNMGIMDNTPPAAPASVTAIAGPIDFSNEVVWLDVPGEVGESYSVYASQKPIANIYDPGVDLLASGIAEAVQSYVHRITYPLKNETVTWYYAVTATDAANNTGGPGVSAAFENTAKGVATISMVVPSNFQADGDISEWDGLGVMPFKMNPEISHIGTGAFSDTTDLSVTGYIGVDDDYLYLSFDIIDDIYSYDPASTYWKSDMMYLYIGLYDHTEKHLTAQRGAEPDYIFHFVQTHIRSYYSEPGSIDTLYVNGDPNYAFVDFGAQDYVVEAKISLDDILRKNQAGDTRFNPENGMRIAIDLEFADSDQPAVRDGLLVYSWDNNNTSYLGPATWSYTWISDTVTTDINDFDNQIVYSYELMQNYPNPFNPITKINYSLAKTSDVKLVIYNVIGQEVCRLVNKKQNPGNYSVGFNAAQFSSGVYFYKIEADEFVQSRKMLLIK
ncbi:MAG: T9SS type A sorting domain-containing protein, partial [Calditrichaeota bacterium]|nr:T9SS type A sorting domain-containing protein [Calditrichota bacterium]